MQPGEHYGTMNKTDKIKHRFRWLLRGGIMQILQSQILIVTSGTGHYLGISNSMITAENIGSESHIVKHPNLPLLFEYPCDFSRKVGKIVVSCEVTDEQQKKWGDKCYNVYPTFNRGVDVSLNTSTKRRNFDFANSDDSDTSTSEDELSSLIIQ